MWSGADLRPALLGALLGALALAACRDHRQLELFAKKPAPAAEMACGEMPCPPHAPICAEDRCVECNTDKDCKKDKPICLAGACVPCATDLDCPKDQACNVAVARCEKRCVTAAECSRKERPVCDPVRGYCVECSISSECKAPRGTCEPESGSCLDCAQPDPCPDCVVSPICSSDAG